MVKLNCGPGWGLARSLFCIFMRKRREEVVEVSAQRASARPLFGDLSLLRHAWWVAAVLAAVLIYWINGPRIERVEYLSNTAGWSVEAPEPDAQSPTGYAGGLRRIIVAGHHNPSYAWIAQTQQTIAEGKFRLRHIDYDNAPEGRETHATSPYRWYLTALAWVDHLFSSRSLAQSVEQAALYADPLLQVGLLASAAVFAAWRFGALAACFVAFASVSLFPLAGNFQAGAPNGHALSWLCGLWSVLPLLAGVGEAGGKAARWWFAVAGAWGGLGLWVDAQAMTPIILGIAAGGIGYALLRLREDGEEGGVPRPWMSWAAAGAVTCLLGYAVEYVPGHVEWAIRSVHPAQAMALLGLGLVVGQVERWRQRGSGAWDLRGMGAALLGLVGVAVYPVIAVLTESGFSMEGDLYAAELANHPAGTIAGSTFAWLARDGLSGLVWTVGLPVGLLLLAVGLLVYPKTGAIDRARLALVVGPVLASLVMAGFQLRWWSMLDVTLLPLGVALLLGGVAMAPRWVLGCVCFGVAAPGAFLSWEVDTNSFRDLDEIEVQAVVERDLAYWLARLAGEEKPVVFAPPALAETLHFYGGLRGVGSNQKENEAGMAATERIASAGTWEEASLLINDRQISYLVLPTWDRSLESIIRMARRVPPGAPTPQDTLVGGINRWSIPPWLRPVPHSVPKAPVFSEYVAMVLALQAEQDEPYATCRLADYFLEMGMMPQAAKAREELALYPRDLSALAMQAQISLALGEREQFAASLEALLPYLSRRSARTLPFDRRISVAVALVGGKKLDEAREQMTLALAEIDSEKIRGLTTSALVRVLAITSLLDMEFPDTALREEILSLIPPTIRAKIGKEK